MYNSTGIYKTLNHLSHIMLLSFILRAYMVNHNNAEKKLLFNPKFVA